MFHVSFKTMRLNKLLFVSFILFLCYYCYVYSVKHLSILDIFYSPNFYCSRYRVKPTHKNHLSIPIDTNISDNVFT